MKLVTMMPLHSNAPSTYTHINLRTRLRHKAMQRIQILDPNSLSEKNKYVSKKIEQEVCALRSRLWTTYSCHKLV
eukprot:c7454_g1_i1 orf=77-301(-)